MSKDFAHQVDFFCQHYDWGVNFCSELCTNSSKNLPKPNKMEIIPPEVNSEGSALYCHSETIAEKNFEINNELQCPTPADEYNLFFRIALICILGIFLWKRWRLANNSPKHKLHFDPKHDLLKLPDVNDGGTFIDRLVAPGPHGLWIISTATLLCISVLDLILYILFKKNNAPNADSWGAIVTLETGVAAVLFPLVILIISKEDGSDRGVVSGKEILLRHAKAFPASIVLLTAMLFFGWGDGTLTSKVVATLSILITVFVVYRLLDVTYSIEARELEEKAIPRAKVMAVTSKNLASRIAFDWTRQAIEVREPDLKLTPFLLSDREGRQDSESIIDVFSERTGIVAELKIGHLKKLAEDIRSIVHSNSRANPGETTPAYEESYSTVSIAIISYLGSTVTANKSLLARVRFVKNENLTGKESDFRKGVLKSFIIKTNSQDSKEQALESLMDNISQGARRGLLEDNSGSVRKATESFIEVYNSFIKKLDDVDIRYDMSSAQKESPFWGFSWEPHQQLLDRLENLIRYSLKPDKWDIEAIRTVLFIPYHLAAVATEKLEALGFNDFVRLAQVEAYAIGNSSDAFRQELEQIPLEWIANLVDYHLKSDIEKADETRRQTLLGFYKVIFRNLQDLGRFAVDMTISQRKNNLKIKRRFRAGRRRIKGVLQKVDVNYLDSVISTMIRVASVFEYEDFETEKLLNRSSENKSRSIRIRKETKNILEQWVQESLIGLASYSLKEFEKTCADTTEKQVQRAEAASVVKSLLERLTGNLTEILAIYVDFHLRHRDEKWGWERWESSDHESGVAYTPATPKLVERTFAMLLLKTLSAGQIAVDTSFAFKLKRNAYLFKEKDRWIIFESRGAPRDFVDLGLTLPADELILKFIENLQEVGKLADQELEREIASQPVLTSKIERFQEAFVHKFLATSRFRTIFHCNFIERDGPIEPLWGINILVHRETFIETPNVRNPDLGNHFGADLGRSEERYIFGILREKGVKVENKYDIVKTISDFVREGTPISNIVVLVSRDQDLYSWVRNEDYVPAYRKKEKEQTFDGFLRVLETEVPVLTVWLPEDEEDAVLILDRERVSIEFILDSQNKHHVARSFHFDLRDPKADDHAAIQIVESEPDWLTTYPYADRKQMSALRLWLRILERVAVSMKGDSSVWVVKLPLLKEE